MNTSTPLSLFVLGLVISAPALQAAIYKESSGIVVVEAEHFDSRTTNTDNHHWHVVPDDNGLDFLADSPGDTGILDYLNPRAGKYVQSLPDSPAGGTAYNTVPQVCIDPHLDFKVQITTPGVYRLWVRWGGYDGSSDSLFGQIVEMKAPAGPGPDWYRYIGNNAGTFAAWNGSGAPSTDLANNVSAGGGEVPAIWTLDAGTYTVRFGMREDGSAVDAMILQLNSLADPADPGPAESATTTTFITVTQQPQDVSIAPGQTATFTVTASGSSPPTYQWQRAAPGSTNFADIAGATGTSFTTGTLTTADDGAKYRVQLSIPGTTISSRVAALTVDVISPIAYRAVGSPTFDKVTIVFSEAVSAATGTNPANYSVAGLTINGAALAAGGTNVILSTSTQTTGAVYTVTVKDINDRITPPNTLSPNPTTLKFTGWVLARGGALHKYWDNITVNNVATLTADPRFPDNPTFYTAEPAFEYPPNGANEGGSNYGNQLSGWVLPPVTGDYVFFVCSDDPSELRLSHDDNPANKHLIAVESIYSNPRQWVNSAGASVLSDKRSDQFFGSEWPTPNLITLTNGRMYFIEVLHTEGTGGDNVGVTWQLPGAAEPIDLAPPIPGTNLMTYMNPDVSTATIRISSPADGVTFAAGANITITADATDTNGPIRRVDFFAGANQVGSTTNNPFSVTWNNVASGRYTLTAKALDRSGFVLTSAAVKIVVGTPPPEVLFVKDNNAGLTAADTAVKSRLESQGLVVTAVGALASLTSDADGKVLIVTSSTVPSGDVGDKFRNVAVPVMSWENALQDNYLFTLDTAADHATTIGQTDIDIVNAAHPMAAGLTAGVHTVVDVATPGEFSWGVPNTNATIIAVMTDDPTHATIYGYEKDATLIDGTTKAPARRVHFLMSDVTFISLNADGLKLFDAAVSWAMGGAQKPVIAAPTLSGGSVSFTWTGGGKLQEAPEVTGSWTDVPGNPQGNYSVQPTGPRKFFRVIVGP